MRISEPLCLEVAYSASIGGIATLIGSPVNSFLATVDDASGIRAFKIYDRYTRADAVAFVGCVIEAFPFRIRAVRTGNVPEIRARLHRHVEESSNCHT